MPKLKPIYRVNVATKAQKKHAREIIEELECRVHLGPPIHDGEILSAREFLRQHDFSAASDYFSRLGQLQHRLEGRSTEPALPQGKRNYGGEAGGYLMQLQSIYDHLILSTCYEGDFNQKQGKVKLSHRFNREGRIDFVELKFLRSFHPCLNGAIRKLLMVKAYQNLRKDWRTAEAFVLPVLPRELILLYEHIFRCSRSEVLAWLVNIGHRFAQDLLEDLAGRPPNGGLAGFRPNGEQLCLEAVRSDEVACPILEKAASLEAAVEIEDEAAVVVRYVRSG